MSHCPKCESTDKTYQRSTVIADPITDVKIYSIDQFLCNKCGLTYEAGREPFLFKVVGLEKEGE